MNNKPSPVQNSITTSQVVVFSLKENLVIESISDNVSIVLGYSVDEMIGKKILDVCFHEDRTKLKSKLEHIIKNGNDYENWELRKQRKDGEIIWVREFIQITKDKEKIEEIKVCCTDVTEQKKVKQVLIESEKKYRNLINNSRNGIVVHSESTILFANPSAIEMVGGAKESDLVGKNIRDFIHPDSAKDIEARIETMNKSGETIGQLEAEYISLDGKIITLQTNASPIKHEGKQAIQVIFRDVTKQRVAERALQESEDKFRSVFNGGNVGIAIADNSNKLIDVNPKFCEMFGYTKNELSKMTFKDLTHPDDVEKSSKMMVELKEGTRDQIQIEKRYFKKDGTLMWGLIAVSRITTKVSGESYSIGIFRDITKRVNAIEALKTRDKILSALNFSTETFLETLEWQANIQEVLKRLGEALNASRSYIFQNHTTESGDILTTQRFKWVADNKYLNNPGIDTENISYKKYSLTRLLELLQNKKVYLGHVKNFSKEERRNFEPANVKSLIIVPIFTIDKLWGLIGFDECRYERTWSNTEIDVLRTAGNALGVAIKRKHFEEELLKAKLKAEESDKLKSQFLAQISHEIRSPIHTILSFSSLIYEDIKDQINEEEKVNFKIITSAGNRITRTIDLILNMSEIQTGSYDYTPRDVDIYSEILTGLITEYKATLKNRNVEFKINKTTNDTIRNVDAYTISHIFVNLLENAFKYTQEGSIELGIHLNKNEALEISVADTGIGIADEYIPKLFKPFSQEEQGYTRTFEGNGLGLALVKSYCEMNNAEIKVESKKGVGTTFKVLFRNR